MKISLAILFIILFTFCKANDTLFIKVHFLYGSKSKKEHKATEGKWFGGLHGGHVGIEYEPNKIIDFVPSGKFHYIEKPDKRHSAFVGNDTVSFWQTFGGNSEDMKKMTVVIPISLIQKKKLDSIVKAYYNETPYDYAFIGMRCAAASYDILSQLEITKEYKKQKTFRKNFYPKRTRKKLVKLANQNNWKIIRKEGSKTRKWEMK